MLPPASFPGNDSQGAVATARAEGSARAFRRRDDRDPVADVQSLIDRLPGVVARLHRSPDGHWSVPIASSDFARMFGIGLPALREDARLLSARIHADDLARLNAAWVLHGELLRNIREHIRVRRPDGHWLTLDVRGTAEPTSDGGLQWNCDFTDIANEAALDEDLRHRLNLWQQATAAAEVGVIDIDVSSGIMMLDRVACRLHGLDEFAEPLSVEVWLAGVVQADRQAARAMLVPPARTADVSRQALRFTAHGGLDERTLEFVLQGSGDGHRLVGACVDSLAQPATPQPQTSDGARAAWGKPDVMSRISHELRTPLNGVMGFAQLMALDQTHPLPAVQQHRLEILRQSGARLLSLIDQLLDVSRIEQGRLRLRSRPIDLRLLVERCAVEIMPLAQQRGIELRVEIPLAAPAVRADPEALEQVVTNLLSNAIKYNRPEGRVRIRFETVDQNGVLSVDDTGLGLSPRQIERLFEPFNRLAADAVDTKGGGLGLHIARKLLRAMGGDIDVLSQAGRGSRFAVSLPLARVESGRSTDQPSDPAQALLWAEGVEAVVLYVEHDDVSAALMQEIFAGQPAWRLLIAASGAEALKLAQQVDVSLVLTDLNLPGMSGIDLRSRLKADPRTRQLRCIAFSADALPQQIERALAQGFDDYWTKPLDVEVLVAKLKYEFRALAELQGSNQADSCR